MADEPNKLQQFEQELRTQHQALTEKFEAQQVKAEAEWAAYEHVKSELSEFRAKYGRVLKALDEGAVKVEG